MKCHLYFHQPSSIIYCILYINIDIDPKYSTVSVTAIEITLFHSHFFPKVTSISVTILSVT